MSVFDGFILTYNVGVRRLLCIPALILLCQCASKHQPQEFAPSFVLRPRGAYSADHLWERRRLEAVEKPTLLEKRRLLDLYQVDLKNLTPGSPWYERLTDEVAYLQNELMPLLEEARHSRETYREKSRERREQGPASRSTLRTARLKREYDQAYQLWNSDQNDAALERVNAVVSDKGLEDDASDEEWYTLHYLRFRIGVDLARVAVAAPSYEVLKRLEPCAEKTSTAGFLVALLQFAAGDAKQALATYESQCDEDTSAANRIKRLYWTARFREKDFPKPEQAYGPLLATRVPGYYAFLACSQLGRTIELPPKLFAERSFLKRPLSVSGRIDRLLTRAEERLQAGVKRDAEAFLLEASVRLGREPEPEDLPTLLYVAHLLQAAESHVEAMRIYSLVSDEISLGAGTVDLPFDFAEDMFPRPHLALVEGSARQWGVDPDLIYSLMRQESAFNPEANSVADARGLMQLMPFLARSLAQQWGYPYYSDRFLFHGDENVRLAAVHLHQLKALVPHIALTAASYNAGVRRVSGWWQRYGHLPADVFVELIPITETRNYVKLVVRNYLFYRALRNRGLVPGSQFPLQLPPFTLSSAS